MPATAVAMAKAAGPLIRTIAIAAGGAPLEVAKIVSSPPTANLLGRAFEHFAPHPHAGIAHRHPAPHHIVEQIGCDHAIHRAGEHRNIFIVNGGEIRQAHEAASLFRCAIDFDIDLHRASPLERACATLHSLPMYARDIARIATPVGVVTIYGDDTAVTSVKIEAMGGGPKLGAASPVRDAADQIQAWFAGERTAFDLPLANAQTDRGQILRDAMIAIGYGEVLSYGRLAATIGSSPRAIGQACARNPFPIIVPCHRVTNADGSLGAYSAGEGPATKRWLLDFERRGHRDRLL